METRIKRWGNSLALRIPRSIAAEAGVEYGSPVDVHVEDGAMIVRPVEHPTVDLKSLLKKVRKSNLHAEISTGKRKGREVW
ncbi:MAG: AbrB/MazE/SpoVT family DNA-binding domain-containing protein [Deltaproteobacteria bacterium]|nr:AbrB/MazE/SpoVT family DNA-binding domain-containing protein [Deltaproteobacteria bacterium]MDQ3301323.1 AbrB/MazE/SpoVT family DNA-binding domain-containing protein [Myxococcota bacterium]